VVSVALTVLALPALAQNAIVTENQLPGTDPSVWDVSGYGDATLQGFATDISVNRGTTVRFKIKTNASAYHVDIYRLGWYGGKGARLVGSGVITASLPQSQPNPLTNTSTGLIDCGNWAESAHWDVPSTAVSGIYVARLVRNDTNGASHIVFVVRDDASHSDLFFQASDCTWQAYNVYGGNSFYTGTTTWPAGRAVKLSYNRPFWTRNGGGGSGEAGEDWLMNAEYPMVRWLEANGYDVSYTTDTDTDRRGSLILNHGAWMSVGHDEYWSGAMRANVEAARDAGVHIAFFSANEVYWKTRWENSTDGTNTPNRTLVCYKEGTLGEHSCGGKCDPLTNVWTGLWRDGCSFSPPADGCRPENALSGQISWNESTSGITVPAEYKDLRFWRNTSVAALGAGQSATLTTNALGYEWDPLGWDATYPAGRIEMSSTVLNGGTHRLSLYRAPSGALVFGGGTVQWSWGLDGTHDRGASTPSTDMRQATVNLLADMGAQPGSLQPGLVAATQTTDAAPPAVTIAAPANGATVDAGVAVTISGTAIDAGTIAYVELSTDNGATWARATGTTSWSYAWTPVASGTDTVLVRGVDDSGNLGVPGQPPTADAITVTVAPRTCPCTIWSDAEAPANPADTDAVPTELGTKFRASVAGTITAIRFWKSTTNTGTHVGSLWTGGGTLLGRATFAGESASGWQEVALATPVAITANTTYLVSYHTDTGHYASDVHGFDTAVDRPPLRALANGEDGPNGVYLYTTNPAFPNQTFTAENYWVDVRLETAPPDSVAPVISGVAATPNGDGTATVTWSTDEPATSRVDWGTSSASLTSNTSDDSLVTSHTVVLGGLAAGTLYYYRVTSADASANSTTSPPPPASPATFTTPPPVITCPTDVTAADFSAGTLSSTYVALTADGEVTLAPALATEFSGAALPSGWTSVKWNNGNGGSSTVSGGSVAIEGSRLTPTSTTGYAAGRVLEFVATFGAQASQQVGLGSGTNGTNGGSMFGSNAQWATFGTDGSAGPNLYARLNPGGDVSVGTGWLGAPHRYRIEWRADSVLFAIDGASVSRRSSSLSSTMRPGMSDVTVGTPLSVDWLRLSPYAASGTFTSRVLDGGGATNWVSLSWNADVPANTSLAMPVRAGNTVTPDGTWSAFVPVSASGGAVGLASRYLQYRAQLATSDAGATPALRDVALGCCANAPPPSAITDLAASRLAIDSNADGTRQVQLAFTPPAGATAIEVYRAGWGDYPAYGGGSLPPVPAYPPDARWTLTAVTASGQVDEPAARDQVYYVAFAKDACGNASAVSNRTAGVLDYLLGDVSDGQSQTCGANNVVDTGDVSLLGAHYGATLAPGDPFACLDVGPTVDGAPSSRPTPDGVLGFEDLMVLGLHYGAPPHENALTGTAAAPLRARTTAATGIDPVWVQPPGPVTAGQVFAVPVMIDGTGMVHGVSATLGWNASMVAPDSVTSGEIADADGIALSPAAGRADAVGFARGFTGRGALARCWFHALADGDPGITLAAVIARDSLNHDLTPGQPLAAPPQSPVLRTQLGIAAPNPFRTRLAIQFTLGQREPVRVTVYDLSGRRVRRLLDGDAAAGPQLVTWDGRSDGGDAMAAGVYLVRLEAGEVRATRRVQLLR